MVLSDFDDIRPFVEGEMKGAFESLLADKRFSKILKGFLPIPVGLRNWLLRCLFIGIKSPQDFQVRYMKLVVKYVLHKCASGHSCHFDESLKKNGAYTFISNHRDIVLDSALLDIMLHNSGFAKTCQIAIGNNLLIYPWIETLVKMNKSFIVRRGLSRMETFKASVHMSQYMHYIIHGMNDNIWMAQREGRAKDSNDLTQESVLKMLVLGGPTEGKTTAEIIQNIKDMNIVPLTISYEYDPCDYLKAQEFQQKRDIERWKKSKQDDLDNMKIGILGKKGHIHYEAAPCINDWLDTLDADSINKADIFEIIAKHIDNQIHRNYKIYSINKDAANGKKNDYIESRIKLVKVDNPDEDFLREKITAMYANPMRNYEKAIM